MIHKRPEGRTLWKIGLSWIVIALLTYFYVAQLGVTVSPAAVLLTCASGSAVVVAACSAEYFATTKSKWTAVLCLLGVAGVLVGLGAGITRVIPISDSSDDLRHMVGRVSFALTGLFIGIGILFVAEAFRQNKTLPSIVVCVCLAAVGLASIWVAFAAESVVGVLRLVATASR